MWKAIHIQIALDDETIEVQTQDLLLDVVADIDTSATPDSTLSTILASSPSPNLTDLTLGQCSFSGLNVV